MSERRRTREEAQRAGPLTDWGKWRAKRDRAIANPRRCKAALKLTQPKKPPE